MKKTGWEMMMMMLMDVEEQLKGHSELIWNEKNGSYKRFFGLKCESDEKKTKKKMTIQRFWSLVDTTFVSRPKKK